MADASQAAIAENTKQEHFQLVNMQQLKQTLITLRRNLRLADP